MAVIFIIQESRRSVYIAECIHILQSDPASHNFLFFNVTKKCQKRHRPSTPNAYIQLYATSTSTLTAINIKHSAQSSSKSQDMCLTTMIYHTMFTLQLPHCSLPHAVYTHKLTTHIFGTQCGRPSRIRLHKLDQQIKISSNLDRKVKQMMRDR